MAETIECVIQSEAVERELWSLAEQILNAFEAALTGKIIYDGQRTFWSKKYTLISSF